MFQVGRNVQIGGWQHDYKKVSTNPFFISESTRTSI